MKGERHVGGLWCSEVLEMLSQYLDDELSSAERSRVEEHLAGCSVCEEMGGEVGTLVGEMKRQLAQPSALDEEVAKRLQSRLDRIVDEE